MSGSYGLGFLTWVTTYIVVAPIGVVNRVGRDKTQFSFGPELSFGEFEILMGYPVRGSQIAIQVYIVDVRPGIETQIH
jgi:hypothetical protein